MKIVVNAKTTDTEAHSLEALAQELGLPEKGVAMAVNNSMVPRSQWGETLLSEGASVVIVKAACGG